MRRKTTEEFIQQANEIHNYKYDYSKSQYEGAKKKVCIICHEKDEFGEEHGEFWQTPDGHLNLKSGCPICANNVQLTTEQFIKKARKIHGNKYDYSKVSYVNYFTNVTIICPIHGEFQQLPSNHLKGEGCYFCGKDRTADSKRVSVNESIEKAKIIHNNFYDYSLTTYDKTSNKVTIICPIHGKFEQVMNNHLRGQGCPKCNLSKGEKEIVNQLNSWNLSYIRQYKINISNDINPSGYAFIDFYLPDQNCFIEYNGIQHYVPVEHFGGELQFQKQLQRDNYVRNYCQDNNIKLIEIKYTDNINIKLKEIYEK